MHLSFRREFSAPARVVWMWLSDPYLMNQWSLGRVQLIAAGQGGHAGAPGAHRRVHVKAGGRTWTLDEVIRDSRPGAFLHYQVVDTAPIRSHTGMIRFEDDGACCNMHWQVDFEFIAPGGDYLVARVLRKQIETSLDTLEQLLGRPDKERVEELPSWQDVDDPTESDWTAGEASLRAQQDLAATLDAKGDPKALFAHIYSFVSEGILDACRQGRFVYPSWALRLLPVFHDYYWRNYQRWCGKIAGPVESHWQRAFHVVEKGTSRYPGADGQLVSGLILSIHAHVESDLPRTLAEVYADHFSQTSDYARFRGDYYCMGQVFVDSTHKIEALIPKQFIPRWARATRELLPEQLVQHMIYRRSYNLPKERRAAFRRGAEIADILVRRQNCQAVLPLEV